MQEDGLKEKVEKEEAVQVGDEGVGGGVDLGLRREGRWMVREMEKVMEEEGLEAQVEKREIEQGGCKGGGGGGECSNVKDEVV